MAVAAGAATIETAIIEACGLLAEGEPMVLLVVYDAPLPDLFVQFQDCHEQAYAWAWLIQPADGDAVSLSWSAAEDKKPAVAGSMPAGLEILRFHLRGDHALTRECDGRQWRWMRHA